MLWRKRKREDRECGRREERRLKFNQVATLGRWQVTLLNMQPLSFIQRMKTTEADSPANEFCPSTLNMLKTLKTIRCGKKHVSPKSIPPQSSDLTNVFSAENEQRRLVLKLWDLTSKPIIFQLRSTEEMVNLGEQSLRQAFWLLMDCGHSGLNQPLTLTRRGLPTLGRPS